MRVAFLVLAHRDPPQVAQLAMRLRSDFSWVLVHVDRNAQRHVFREFREVLCGLDGVRLLRERHRSYHGSYGIVAATLAGMRAALALEPAPDYVQLLSGQDYPVRPLAQYFDFLANADDFSFIEARPFPVPGWQPDGGYARVERRYFSLPLRKSRLRDAIVYRLNACAARLPRRKAPAGLVLHGGSQWWTLSRTAVEYLLCFVASRPEIARFFQLTRDPDEIFFHSILMSSSLASRVRPRSLTYVDWNGPPYPRILGATDLSAVGDSGCFFARKIDWYASRQFVETVDATLISGGVALSEASACG